MASAPKLQEVARRLITSQMGANRQPHELVSVAVSIFETLLTTLSPVVGTFGSQALLGRSLTLTTTAFPCYGEVRGAEHALLDAVGACLRKQEPDVAMEATVALLTAYMDLLATFIGEPLTMRLLQEAWPDLLTFPPQER